MKQLFPVFLFAFVFISASSFKPNNVHKDAVEAKARIEVIFSHTLNFNDVVKIKLDLSEKGIVINFKELKFDENNLLLAIDFFVDCKDGYHGGSSKTGLTDQSRFGFFRDYAKDAKVVFRAGDL